MERYIQIREAAKQCGVSARTFRRWLEMLGWRRAQPWARLVPESIAQQAIQAHSGKLVRQAVKRIR